MIIHPELMIFLVMDGDYTIWTISVLQMTNTEELRIKTNKAWFKISEWAFVF